MGESFEILFWLAVFVFFALRGAAQKRSKTSRPAPQDAGSAPEGERRGIFADLMRQIEAQMEAQAPQAEARTADGGASTGGGETRMADGDLAPLEPGRPTPAAARRSRVETVAARAHPADRRPEVRGSESTGVRFPTDRGTGEDPWHRPAGDESRDPERRHLPAEPTPARAYVVPGRRVHAQGTVEVGRSPETASALRRSSATAPIGGAGSGEDVPRVERASGRTGAGGLGRLDAHSPLRRAILLSEVLDPPPGLTGRTPLDRRLEEIG